MFEVLQKDNFDVCVFVDYKITTVPRALVNDLNRHLLGVVWGEWRLVDESIFLTNAIGDVKRDCDIVRYQFGDMYEAEERMAEVGELIQAAFNTWPNLKSDSY